VQLLGPRQRGFEETFVAHASTPAAKYTSPVRRTACAARAPVASLRPVPSCILLMRGAGSLDRWKSQRR
jgi:hypothetical protein